MKLQFSYFENVSYIDEFRARYSKNLLFRIAYSNISIPIHYKYFIPRRFSERKQLHPTVLCENLHIFHIKRTYHITLGRIAENTEKLEAPRQRIESSKWHTQTSTKLPQ